MTEFGVMIKGQNPKLAVEPQTSVTNTVCFTFSHHLLTVNSHVLSDYVTN